MAYIEPTPNDVRLDFPEFSALTDPVIQRRIDRASLWVDQSWPESIYTYAKELVAARYLERDGYPGAASGGGSGSSGSMVGITRIKSAQFEAAQTNEAANAELGDFWSGSKYASEWLTLLYRVKGGPRIVMGDIGCIGPQSTDVPFAYKYGGFGL